MLIVETFFIELDRTEYFVIVRVGIVVHSMDWIAARSSYPSVSAHFWSDLILFNCSSWCRCKQHGLNRCAIQLSFGLSTFLIGLKLFKCASWCRCKQRGLNRCAIQLSFGLCTGVGTLTQALTLALSLTINLTIIWVKTRINYLVIFGKYVNLHPKIEFYANNFCQFGFSGH